MPPYKLTHAQDNKIEDQQQEMVGSADLKALFTEKGSLRGSFSINGANFPNVVMSSPGDVVRQINSKEYQTGVRASIDDGFHLVLEADGPIEVASGHAYDEAQRKQAEQQQGAVSNLTADQIRDRRARGEAGINPPAPQPPADDLVQALGLEAKGNYAAPGQSASDWQPGDTKEQREERREQERLTGRPARAMSPEEQAADYERKLKQGTVGGGTTTINQGPSDTSNPDPHNPPGYPKPGRPSGHPQTQEGLAPPRNVQPESRNNPGTRSDVGRG